MDHDEIEVKFHVFRMDDLRRRVVELGASSAGRVFEKNIRFEDAEESLLAAKSLLRLRHDGKSILTYKQAATSEDDQFKVYREIETEVSDYEATLQILKELGYSPRQVYEKYRETFAFKGAVLCLDTMPYGDFLEIEGEKTRIRELSDRLELDWDKRILATYLEMFAYIKKTASLDFEDLTFDNFQALRRDFSDCWRYFEQRPAC
jgi:adenylate cyclase class 2